MKRFFALLLLLALVGCAAPADPLAYQREGACLTLSGQIDSLTYAAELMLDPVLPEEALDTRGFILTYTAPASLCGITLTRSDGRMTLSRGALTAEDADGRFAGMALPAALFCIDCTLQSAAVLTEDGATLNRVEASDDEGSYILWLDADGFPRRIEGRIGERTVSADVLTRSGYDSPRTERTP